MNKSNSKKTDKILNFEPWPERWPGPGTYIWISEKNHHFLIINPLKSIIRNLNNYVRMSDSDNEDKNWDSLYVNADSLAWPEQWPEPGIYEWTSDKNYYYLVVTPLEAITTFEHTASGEHGISFYRYNLGNHCDPTLGGGAPDYGYSPSSYDYYNPNSPDVCWDPCAGSRSGRDTFNEVKKIAVDKKRFPFEPGCGMAGDHH